MYTAIALVGVAVFLLAVELYALRYPEDRWWTITATMRKLPKWAVALIMFGGGVLVGHFYWP